MGDPQKSASQVQREEAKAAEEKQRKADAERREKLAAASDDEAKKAEEAAAAEAAEDTEEEPRFEIEDLLNNARTVVGVSRHVLAGALSKETRKTVTRAEAEAAVKNFTSRKVGEN